MMMGSEGVYGVEYHEGRKARRALKYRLGRRTKEVHRAICLYGKTSINGVLDVGTADGLMLKRLRALLGDHTVCVGLDLSMELLSTVDAPFLHPLQATALDLPFADNVCDVVIATAVIEHVSAPGNMKSECYRVLRDGGICILTTPDPFFDKIAGMIGHVEREGHKQTFNVSELKSLLEKTGFRVLESEKFMMSPIGFPFELSVEKLMKRVRLGFLLLNQIVVGRKI